MSMENFLHVKCVHFRLPVWPIYQLEGLGSELGKLEETQSSVKWINAHVFFCLWVLRLLCKPLGNHSLTSYFLSFFCHTLQGGGYCRSTAARMYRPAACPWENHKEWSESFLTSSESNILYKAPSHSVLYEALFMFTGTKCLPALFNPWSVCSQFIRQTCTWATQGSKIK